MGDTVSKIIDEYESQLNFYYSELRNYNEKEKRILKGLRQLEFTKYQIIVLRYIKRMPWEEIAIRMNYSRRQCINIKNAAVAELKQLCED
jgi:DNA-directed RNA polymerase specialized sigma subunit